MRFTDLGVARLKPQKKRFMRTEGNGLYLQVLPGGTKKWVHFHRGNKQQWISLGYFPNMDVTEARKRNEEAAKFVTTDTTGQALNFNSTMEDLFKEWFGNAKDKKGKPWSAAYKRNVQYIFDATVLPLLGEKRLRDITKADIRVLLQNKEKSKPGQAREIYKRLSRIFNYAAQQDYIEVSPMANLEPIGTTNVKDRHLSQEEIKTFLESLPDSDMVPKTACALEIILRTGQRSGEVLGATKSEIQGDWWVIPGRRTKNNLEQRVPLTKTIKALFGEANQHGLFFPSPRDEEKPMSPLALSKALRRSLTGGEKKPNDNKITIPIKPTFSPHDLRRTCATGLGSMQYSIEVIAAVLNHKPRTVTGIHYMLHQYDKEKQKALGAWERKLKAIVSEQKSDNVIPLAR